MTFEPFANCVFSQTPKKHVTFEKAFKSFLFQSML